MKTTRKLFSIASAIAAGLLAGSTLSVMAQTSVGVHFVSADSSDINNSSPDALAPTDSAGFVAQTNWNNLGRYGSSLLETVVLNDSAGAATSLSIWWDATSVGSTGTGTGLGTPDGKLMDGYIYTYSPGAATPFSQNPYSSGNNNKPLAYVAGLNAWCAAQGAIGYKVIIYCTGQSGSETAQGFIESASGHPEWWQMAEGSVLTPYLYAQDTGNFSGTYVPATSTSSGSPTAGGNYMEFDGLTSDVILIRLQCPSGYGAGMNGFQIIPVFAAPGLSSVGVHFVSAGGDHINNSSPDALAPTDSAGIAGYAQTNWNNLGRYGDSVTLTDSTGTATSLSIMWDADSTDATGASTATPDGKLMSGFLYTYGPGAATAFNNNPYSAGDNNKPLAYVGGLNAWCAAQGAAGYNVVIYTTGYSYSEPAEGFIESATGNPVSYNMVEGDVLTTPLFARDTGNFSGSYVLASGTSIGSATGGGNYMTFYSLTNDAILIRLQCLGYGAGLSGFQIVPVASITPAIPPVITLNITNIAMGTNVVSWSAGTLQTATNVLGPWTYNYTPSSFTDTTTNAAQFYRVWVQK